MSNNWNLNKLERQAIGNQKFDEYILKQSGIEFEGKKVENRKFDLICPSKYKDEIDKPIGDVKGFKFKEL